MEALIHGNRRLIGRRLEGVSGRVLAVVTEALQQEPDLAKISDRALVDKARAALLRAGVEDESPGTSSAPSSRAEQGPGPAPGSQGS